MSSAWSMPVPRERIDWHAIKNRIDLEAVAVALLGPPAKRQGGRLLWRCPFHDDRNPSFVVDPERGRWKCWPCDLGGDPAELVMRLKAVSFPEAVRHVAELCGLAPASGIARPTIAPKPTARAPGRPPDEPTGLPPADASALVEESARRLWEPVGAQALSYLHERGLADETIRSARLGFVASAMVPTRDGNGCYRVSGVTIPWREGNRIAKINVRQFQVGEAKYKEAFRDRPAAFPSLAAIRPGRRLVACEGEFDALLLGQQIGDQASVVTTGSASDPPGPAVLEAARRCPVVFAAHDADEAGDKAAASWPARARRVRPPEGCNDWTEAHATGFNRVRYLWGEHLPMSTTWERLASQRWGRPDAPDDLGGES